MIKTFPKKRTLKIKKIYKELKKQNKSLFNISTLSSAYPTGDYLIGNFITVYTNNADQIDRYFVKRYGERSVIGEWDQTDAEIIADWEYDTQAIFFTHLNDWAKMFSALLKDYEPLWNVDGTEVTTYGETHKEDKYGATHSEDKFGATHSEDKYGNAVTTVAHPQYSDTHTTSKTTYPDATKRATDEVVDAYGQHTTTTTDQLHTDEHDVNLHTNEHDERLHTNEFDEDEHDVTLRRTGNIGTTKSTDLVISEISLRSDRSFFSIILAVVVEEMGCRYYD